LWGDRGRIYSKIRRDIADIMSSREAKITFAQRNYVSLSYGNGGDFNGLCVRNYLFYEWLRDGFGRVKNQFDKKQTFEE
jgi:hypothetical protein